MRVRWLRRKFSIVASEAVLLILNKRTRSIGNLASRGLLTFPSDIWFGIGLLPCLVLSLRPCSDGIHVLFGVPLSVVQISNGSLWWLNRVEHSVSRRDHLAALRLTFIVTRPSSRFRLHIRMRSVWCPLIGGGIRDDVWHVEWLWVLIRNWILIHVSNCIGQTYSLFN